MKATARDLRVKTREILRAVERGEEVVVTHRGQPRAKLVPISQPPKRRRSSLFGIWKNDERTRDVDAYVSALRSSRR